MRPPTACSWVRGTVAPARWKTSHITGACVDRRYDDAQRQKRHGYSFHGAQDPVFFSHHGNIDRLWSVWLGLSPQHQNFTNKLGFRMAGNSMTKFGLDADCRFGCDRFGERAAMRVSAAVAAAVWSFTSRPPRIAITTAAPEPA